MVELEQLLKPNKFKIILALLLLVPLSILIVFIFTSLFSISGMYYFSLYQLYHLSLYDLVVFSPILLVLALIGLFLAYLLSGFIDHYIPNRNAKIMIALISGIVTIILVYIIYKIISEPIICDPVHVSNHTEEYSLKFLNEVKINKEAVTESLNKCLKFYYR
ncbi:MAG: hypothetical protein FJ150_09695 [Euryarchaeota archaeon]|nr:hypothetical protein [Euryarchaeota archaeon]